MAYLAYSLECPADGKGGAERIEAHVFMFRFGKAAVGDVLVKSTEVDRKSLRDRDPDAGTDGETEAEILSLGFGGTGGVGEHEADAGFEIGDDGPAILDEIIAGAEETAGEPWVWAVNDRGVHPAKEELCVAPVPAIIADFVQLPSHRD